MANLPNSEQDKLVSESIAQVDPYRVTGKDFPVKTPAGHEYGFESGKDELVDAPCGVRHLEDGGEGSGYGTPSVWGKGGKAFPVGKNGGEGESKPSGMSYGYSINCESGDIMPNVHDIRNVEVK